MIKTMILLTFLSLGSALSFGQDDSTKKDTLEVKVRLITNLDSINLPPYCGEFAWEMIFEFEIIKVLSGDYTNKTISINIQCPREVVQNKCLETGKEYQYHLIKGYKIKEILGGDKYKELDFYERVY